MKLHKLIFGKVINTKFPPTLRLANLFCEFNGDEILFFNVIQDLPERTAFSASKDVCENRLNMEDSLMSLRQYNAYLVLLRSTDIAFFTN